MSNGMGALGGLVGLAVGVAIVDEVLHHSTRRHQEIQRKLRRRRRSRLVY